MSFFIGKEEIYVDKKVKVLVENGEVTNHISADLHDAYIFSLGSGHCVGIYWNHKPQFIKDSLIVYDGLKYIYKLWVWPPQIWINKKITSPDIKCCNCNISMPHLIIDSGLALLEKAYICKICIAVRELT